MGGTMTAEAALMGVPAISAFQGSLYTDSYLVRAGLMAKALDTKTLLSNAKRLLKEPAKEAHRKKAKRILDAMEDPVPKVAGYVGKIAN
jgi:uncharacterized protein